MDPIGTFGALASGANEALKLINTAKGKAPDVAVTASPQINNHVIIMPSLPVKHADPQALARTEAPAVQRETHGWLLVHDGKVTALTKSETGYGADDMTPGAARRLGEALICAADCAEQGQSGIITLTDDAAGVQARYLPSG